MGYLIYVIALLIAVGGATMLKVGANGFISGAVIGVGLGLAYIAGQINANKGV